MAYIRSPSIHFQLDLSKQIFKFLAFEAILFTFSLTKFSLKLSLKLTELKWEKVVILRLLKNAKNFAHATSKESCFGIENEVLLNLDIVMKEKLVLF